MKAAALLACASIFAGCGSSPNPVAREQVAVSHLRAVLHTYNASAPRNLTQQAAACRRAAGSLHGGKPLPVTQLPRARRVEAAALIQAYQLARKGFQTCAKVSTTLNYPQMLLATDDLAKATSWIQQARGQEHGR